MTIKHQPATPLPWRVREGYGRVELYIDASKNGAGGPEQRPLALVNFCGTAGVEGNVANAAYIAHAANAYPKLVEALREAIASYERGPELHFGSLCAGAAILRELGEAS